MMFHISFHIHLSFPAVMWDLSLSPVVTVPLLQSRELEVINKICVGIPYLAKSRLFLFVAQVLVFAHKEINII